MNSLKDYFERGDESSLEFRRFLLTLIEEARNGFIHKGINSETGEEYETRWENDSIEGLLSAIGRLLVADSEFANGIINQNAEGLTWDQLMKLLGYATEYE